MYIETFRKLFVQTFCRPAHGEDFLISQLPKIAYSKSNLATKHGAGLICRNRQSQRTQKLFMQKYLDNLIRVSKVTYNSAKFLNSKLQSNNLLTCFFC